MRQRLNIITIGTLDKVNWSNKRRLRVNTYIFLNFHFAVVWVLITVKIKQLKRINRDVLLSSTRSCTLREKVYESGNILFERIIYSFTFPTPLHCIIWYFMSITGLFLKSPFQPYTISIYSLKIILIFYFNTLYVHTFIITISD